MGVMSQPDQDRTPDPAGAGRFPSTHWSDVLAAGRGATPGAGEALAALCRAYWYPLYAYVRRRGHDAHAARDLTQEFFARMLEKNYLADADPAKGRFRSFLLAALNHFLANERDRARALKRGGGRPPLSLDFATAEHQYSLEPVDEGPPRSSSRNAGPLPCSSRRFAASGRSSCARGSSDTSTA